MGVKEVPLPTYFIEGPSASAEAKYGSVVPGGDVFPKCTYLGPGGLELVGKLTVGFLSQRHTDKDIEKIVEPASSSTFLGADIFLSTDWGQGVAAGYDLSAMGVRDAAGTGSSTVADLAVVLRPRYHFAARPGIYFQRPPYKNHASKPKSKLSHVTRFLSLAPASVAKEKARKWLHAISIEPIPYMTLAALVDEPADVTESPYSVFRTAGMASHKWEGSGGQGEAGRRTCPPASLPTTCNVVSRTMEWWLEFGSRRERILPSSPLRGTRRHARPWMPGASPLAVLACG
ncbi:cwf19-like protein 1 [Nannochloropsis gaditana]|uniref:Cwf19-like protein 1 n=1 Tax=Nannochloropsis gaditana TaxID=72520 RepID=W7TM72_9STRA|nr:cwf19-like protein 1 [Nannochloropsis gaditana]